MKQNNKKCMICGKVYTYCPNCAAFTKLPRWMNLFHDENCRKIFHIVSKYRSGDIDKENAKIDLNTCNLSNQDQFTSSIQDALKEIYEFVPSDVNMLEDNETSLEYEKVSNEVIEQNKATEKKTKRSGRKKRNIVNDN